MAVTQAAIEEIPSRDVLLERAGELVPSLAERALATDRDAWIPDESFAELEAAGMMRLGTPRAYGGYELSMSDFVEVLMRLGEGCTATGWVVGIMNSASWEAALFPKEAQDEVFEGNPDVRIATVPQVKEGSARVVNGGLVIDRAKWFFNSGVRWSEWVVNGVPVLGPDGEMLDMMLCLIPVEEMKVNDDWATIGMRGTQSVSTEVEDLFVPSHRTISTLTQLMRRRFVHPYGPDHPLYRVPIVPAFSLYVSPNGVAMANVALQRFTRKAEGKSVAYTTIENQADNPTTHFLLGEATMKADAARELIRRAAADTDRWAANDEEMPVKERIRARAQCAYALKLAAEAVDTVYTLSGGSAIHEREQMQRLWRDSKTITLHGLFAPSSTLELHGRMALDREPNSLFI